ncbi:MAG: purine-nucleoside phosphorylase [Clostridia bacterium]|nr:purine-nucleoside phosphorylase [Clostridia bacterium]
MDKPQFPTPHINARPEDFAKTVLMPGDPLRSEFIAKNFLKSAKLINNIRGIQGYTGSYKGTPISVMASGMGMPSMGIYSYELFNFFGVDNIIRVGSAGAIQENVRVRDIILGIGACTNSAYFHQFGLPGNYSAVASFDLLYHAKTLADKMNIPTHTGLLLSSDMFYDEDPQIYKKWKNVGVLAIEMESAALYINAAKAGKNALALCTVSDQLITYEYVSAEERQTSFTQMIELALNLAVSDNK